MTSIYVNRRQVLALGFAPFANSAAGAGVPPPGSTPTFSRGINFHHVLNWPALRTESKISAYIWPAFASEIYKLRPDDVSLVRSLGFDFIRLTVDPGIWIAEGVRHPGELERRYFDSVETLLAANLNVVFDLAPVNNHPDYTPTRLISLEGSQEFAAYAGIVARAAKLLSQISPDRIALELFNEPPLTGERGEAGWAAMQTLLHLRARDVAPDLTLILTSAHWGDGAALTRLDASPYRASNVIYTFHYYDPHLFTHQGTNAGAMPYISGVDWPLRPEQTKQAKGDAENAVAADPSLDDEARTHLRQQISDAFAGQSARPSDDLSIGRDFDEVAAWARAHAIAPQRILLGEFGCVLASRGRATGEARLRWLAVVRREAEARRFGWAYWAFKGFGGMELVDPQGALHTDLVAPLGLNAVR